MTDERSDSKKQGKFISSGTREFLQGWGLLIVFGILCTIFALSTPVFLKGSNLINVIRQVSIIGTAAMGMAILMISGGIDLSVGSHLAFTGLVVAMMLNKFSLPVWAAILITLCFSLMVGVINSLLVTMVKIPPFIATLGMMSVLRGTGYIMTGGIPVYDFPTSFIILGRGYIGPIPIPAIIMLAVFLFAYFLINRTYLGRYFYALGGNEVATRLSGIDVVLTRTIAYALCGLFVGVAGLILLARINSAQPSAGSGFEMDVITAVVLGGVSMSGGQGKIQNVLLGVLIIGVIANGLVLLNVHDYYQIVIKGMTLLMAVAVDKFGKRA